LLSTVFHAIKLLVCRDTKFR